MSIALFVGLPRVASICFMYVLVQIWAAGQLPPQHASTNFPERSFALFTLCVFKPSHCLPEEEGYEEKEYHMC